MSNEYFVTISLQKDLWQNYKVIIQRLTKDVTTLKYIVTQQMGTNNHKHYHLIVESSEVVPQKFRQRFRAYYRPLIIDRINLVISQIDVKGKTWNYLHRDPSLKIIANRGYDLDAIKREALAFPDYKKKFMPWAMLPAKLLSVGYKYPERPGKYLRILSREYDVYHIITNCKKLSNILRFEFSKEGRDWDDQYITIDNKSVMI